MNGELGQWVLNFTTIFVCNQIWNLKTGKLSDNKPEKTKNYWVFNSEESKKTKTSLKKLETKNLN